MQSDGGLAEADKFRGFNALLSGPAGGVVGYAMTTYRQMGQKPVIGFDMGGTSTDVARFDGTFEKTYESRKAGVRIMSPMLEIETSKLIAAMKPMRPSLRRASEFTDSRNASGETKAVIAR